MPENPGDIGGHTQQDDRGTDDWKDLGDIVHGFQRCVGTVHSQQDAFSGHVYRFAASWLKMAALPAGECLAGYIMVSVMEHMWIHAS
jgi:hypothetical protein